MQALLVISNIEDDIEKIRRAFDTDVKIDGIRDFAQAAPMLSRARYDWLFVDLDIMADHMHGGDFSETLNPLQKQSPSIEIVIMAAPEHIRKAVGLVKQGASDYITYPVSTDEVRLVVDTIKKTAIRQSELDYLRDKFWKADALEVIQTKSPAMVEVFKKIRSVAATKTTVILTGETGTGKSVLAKLIHQHSNRQKAQFISVHCGAIPDTLLESELFGHEKGAFTGATRQKPGRFEQADGGTVFLDEIGEIPPPAQIKLLRVLQTRKFERVGGEKTLTVDVRVLAATNKDLMQEVEKGNFREDLFYRLNVIPLNLPPLRDRRNDIPLLALHFLKSFVIERGKALKEISSGAMRLLLDYPWPGNVRELENSIEHAVVLAKGSQLEAWDLPTALQHPSASQPPSMADQELKLLLNILEECGWNKKLAARRLGISRSTVYAILKRHNISKPTTH